MVKCVGTKETTSRLENRKDTEETEVLHSKGSEPYPRDDTW